MSTVVIRFEHVSKRYRLGARHGSLREALAELPRHLRRRGHYARHSSLALWALKDVSFEVNQGEALGIIGPNGAGKTSILKLLAGVTKPTSGQIDVSGRVGALIALGAGFHPDLTGRENISLSGVILGLSRAEIRKKFDSIVEFSGLDRFLDTPVKHYSSGMYIRLGFAVAAHIDPDVLLIDEVLSVGDASFRRKCVQRIHELREAETTVVFVSHNLSSMKAVCDRAILLNDGQVLSSGDVDVVLQEYEKLVRKADGAFARGPGPGHADSNRQPAHADQTSSIRIVDVELLDNQGQPQTTFSPTDDLVVRVKYCCAKPVEDPAFSISIDGYDGVICTIRSDYQGFPIPRATGVGWVSARLSPLQLNTGSYRVTAAIMGVSATLLYDHDRVGRPFDVIADVPSGHPMRGIFLPCVEWEYLNAE